MLTPRRLGASGVTPSLASEASGVLAEVEGPAGLNASAAERTVCAMASAEATTRAPLTDRTPLAEATALVLAQLELNRPTLSTLVLSGFAECALPTGRLWSVLEDVPSWPSWSPLHSRVTWIGSPDCIAGSRFAQVLDLGFPVGTKTEPVTIGLAEPGRLLGWAGSGGGIRSCHVWRLDARVDGTTAVSNVEAFIGLPVALVRPFVAARWRRQFQQAVDGLIAAAEGKDP